MRDPEGPMGSDCRTPGLHVGAVLGSTWGVRPWTLWSRLVPNSKCANRRRPAKTMATIPDTEALHTPCLNIFGALGGGTFGFQNNRSMA